MAMRFNHSYALLQLCMDKYAQTTEHKVIILL